MSLKVKIAWVAALLAAMVLAASFLVAAPAQQQQRTPEQQEIFERITEILEQIVGHQFQLMELLARMSALGEEIKGVEDEISNLEAQLEALRSRLPSSADEDVQRLVEEMRRRLEAQQGTAQIMPITPLSVEPVVPVGPVAATVGSGAIAVAGFSDALVVDVGGDGLDLSGWAQVDTDAGTRRVNWTTSGTDDAFVVVDALTLSEAGYDISDASGVAIRRTILLGDGMRVNDPSGNTLSISDAWQMLSVFDANKDGLLSAADPAWQHLGLFTDSNADGRADAGELSKMWDASVRSISLRRGPQRQSTMGFALIEGTFERADGTTGRCADVLFR